MSGWRQLDSDQRFKSLISTEAGGGQRAIAEHGIEEDHDNEQWKMQTLNTQGKRGNRAQERAQLNIV